VDDARLHSVIADGVNSNPESPKGDSPSAIACLEKSLDSCLTFFNFPKQEWIKNCLYFTRFYRWTSKYTVSYYKILGLPYLYSRSLRVNFNFKFRYNAKVGKNPQSKEVMNQNNQKLAKGYRQW